MTNMFSLEGKNAWITGASYGIGFNIAKAFVAAGINHIIFNEKCRIVSKFKDFLILDDATEFLKAFYKKPETILKLKQIFLFYETYRKIFPNYIAIFPENKHLYRNIRKKRVALWIAPDAARENPPAVRRSPYRVSMLHASGLCPASSSVSDRSMRTPVNAGSTP